MAGANAFSYRRLSSISGYATMPKRFSDLDIWSYAKDNDFTIVTFDADFYEWQLIRGYPPKVIWLRLGNTKTEIIASELIESLDQIRNFISDRETGLLEIHK